MTSATRPPLPVCLTVQHHDTGVVRVVWRLDGGRPDTFLVAHTDRVDPRWLRLSDVLVGPTRATVTAADEFAADALHEMTGCALVAVGVRSLGCVIRSRNGDRTLVGPDAGTAGTATRWAVLGYPLLVTTGRLDLL
jgi:hypothetical protein